VVRLFLSASGSDTLNVMGDEAWSRSLLPFPVRAEYPPFAIVSDTHIGARNSVYPHFLEVMDQLKIETIIHTGDVINKPGSSRQWKKFFEATGPKRKVHIAPGNHDIRFRTSREVYHRLFPKQYYSFSVGDTLFVMLNTTLPRQRSRVTGAQLAWLRMELARPFRFKLVFLHEPLFPALPLQGLNVFKRSRDALHRLFVESGVNLVVAGHNHIYRRSTRNGVTYVVTANTGGKLFPVGLVSKKTSSFRYIAVTRLDGHYHLETRDLQGRVTDRFTVSPRRVLSTVMRRGY